MARAGRYDILFEPMAIGPVTAKNRFYQVPHCNGGGYRDPSAAAEMRGVKAQGGWGVIFTEQCEMHHSSEITPFIELRLWDDKDIPMIARMADKMKEFGALAGIQLAYSGINGPNLYTKEVPLAPSAMPIRTFTNDPVNARAMDKQDIRDLRRWFVNAAKRSRTAGFDLICLYGAHGFGIFQHFLSTATNQRSDEYGGNLENRARFVREVVADLRDEVGDTMGLTLRLSLEEMIGDLGFANSEVRDFIEMHKDLPDLWDLAHGAWEDCSGPSRFKEEAAQFDLVTGIKSLTTRPVVGVGRFTSPDVMVKMLKSGTLDFIGCARPSIADPFLPNKIEEGRIDDIRECIGCNMLPGLSAWGRVADYRIYQLSRKSNVETYLDSALSAEQILEFGFENVAIATGSSWRRDGVSRQHVTPMPIDQAMPLYTPDDLMAGKIPTGKVIVFDDDHYYLVGVDIQLNRGVTEIVNDGVISNCVYTDQTRRIEADAVVMVASRTGDDAVYKALKVRESDWADAGIRSVQLIGDANAPGPIAWAVYAGHRFARELDTDDIGDALPFRREITELAAY